MNKLPIFSAALTVCLLFSACGIREASPPSSSLPAPPHSDAPMSEMPSGSSPAGDPALSESGQEPEEEAAEPSQKPEPSKTETQVSLDFGGITVLAEMDDSETTKAFLNRLPLTLSMDRYADREYYAAIPALPENEEAIPDFENGDITYYTSGNSLAIFFGNAGNSHQAGLIRMGRITSDLAAFDSIGDSVEVTIRLAGEEGEREMQSYDLSVFSNVEVTGADLGELSEEQLSVLYQQARYCQAMTEMDTDTMGEIVSEEMVFTHMSGRRQSREEYFADVKSGSLRYFTIGIEDPVVEVEGDLASVRFTSVLNADAYGARGTYRITGTHWYQRKNGVWTAVNAPIEQERI